MSKCPQCSSRKGKRHCPALHAEICAPCCAEGRLKTIPCPQDCPYLESELYQHRRRKERALSHGRELIATNQKLFDAKPAADFAFNLEADIYYYLRQNGPVDDATLADALEALQGYLSRVFVPPPAPHPILSYLIERTGDGRRYGEAPGLSTDDRRRVLRSLVSHLRSPGAAGRAPFHEVLASFFSQLDFEADLDYSPEDPRAAAPEDGLRRTSSGLILPP